jgi:hypothetical protein
MSDRHPRFFELVSAVRSRHVRLLADLTAPGGRCALVTDIVSSLTYPPLRQTSPEALPGTLQRLIAAGNFFTGLNPAMVRRVFLEDPLCAGLLTDVTITPPWLWDLGPRVYAVFAALAKRVD